MILEMCIFALVLISIGLILSVAAIKIQLEDLKTAVIRHDKRMREEDQRNAIWGKGHGYR